VFIHFESLDAGGALPHGETVEGEFTGLPAGFDTRNPEHGAIASSLTSSWTFDPGGFAHLPLTVIPSGRAGLSVQVSVFHRQTEEMVVRDVLVDKRTTIPLRLPADGEYTVEIKPVRMTASGGDGSAKYTLQLGNARR
jgi:hypothetical protein